MNHDEHEKNATAAATEEKRGRCKPQTVREEAPALHPGPPTGPGCVWGEPRQWARGISRSDGGSRTLSLGSTPCLCGLACSSLSILSPSRLLPAPLRIRLPTCVASGAVASPSRDRCVPHRTLPTRGARPAPGSAEAAGRACAAAGAPAGGQAGRWTSLSTPRTDAALSPSRAGVVDPIGSGLPRDSGSPC